MSKRQFIILLGIWIMVLPSLGFPAGWDNALLVATGLLIVVISFMLKPEVKAAAKSDAIHVDNHAE